MAGVMQSEYSCPFDGARPISAKTLFSVQREEVDRDGCVELMELKQTSGDAAGIMLCLFPREIAPAGERELQVALHWLSHSPGEDKNISRRLAGQVEAMLLEKGAVCSRSPVRPADARPSR